MTSTVYRCGAIFSKVGNGAMYKHGNIEGETEDMTGTATAATRKCGLCNKFPITSSLLLCKQCNIVHDMFMNMSVVIHDGGGRLMPVLEAGYLRRKEK